MTAANAAIKMTITKKVFIFLFKVTATKGEKKFVAQTISRNGFYRTDTIVITAEPRLRELQFDFLTAMGFRSNSNVS